MGVADRVVSAKIATPVLRWRKMVRLFDPPPDARCSRKTFQAVAAALADYADRNGSSCWPSVATLCADTGFTRRSVQYALAALCERGLLARDTRGGRGRSTRYELVCRRVDKPVDQTVDNAQLSLERAHLVHEKGATRCARGLPERSAKFRIPVSVRRVALVTT